MQRINNSICFLAGLLVAGSVSFAVAAPAGMYTGPAMPMAKVGWHHPGMMHHTGQWWHDPAYAVIMDLHGIARLDRMNGHSTELPALYQHVLDTTQNPRVRHYAYLQLARSQMKPADAAQALATLRKSLDEDLARLDAGKKH